MLSRLLEIRKEDSFIFVVRRGSENSPLLKEFLNSCDLDNWELYVEPLSRRLSNGLGLLNYSNYCSISVTADVYLNIDLDYLGPNARPLIATIMDLSIIRIGNSASVPWYGRIIRKNALNLTLQHAAKIVAISKYTKQDIEDYDPGNKCDIKVVYNGISDCWHNHGDSHNKDSATHSTIEIDKPYFIWCGYITKRKNIKNLLHAYKKALASDDFPHLLLVGDLGRDSTDIPVFIKQLGLTKHVTQLGFQPETSLIKLVNDSCGLLFPSLYEGFGLPVVEALALGKPVLISNRSSLPEIAGDLACVCDPENIDDMCRGILDITNGEDPSSDCINKRKTWAQQFTYDKAASAYSDVIDSVVNAPAFFNNESN